MSVCWAGVLVLSCWAGVAGILLVSCWHPAGGWSAGVAGLSLKLHFKQVFKFKVNENQLLFGSC